MKSLSPSEISQLILSVGTHRSERLLSPIEVARLINRTIEAGEKREQIAERLHLNDSTIIGRFLRLLSLPSQVQQLINWGSNSTTLSFSVATEIARLKYTQQQISLAKAALENQFNKSEIVQVIQLHNRSGNPIESCIEAVIKQRPTIERRHLILGELRSKELIVELKSKSQQERNELLRSTLERYIHNISPMSVKLGDGLFLLVGDDRFHNEVMSISDDIEKTITDYLIVELRSKD